MRVKTIRKHSNAYAPVYVKNVGRKYVLPEKVAQNLITAGLVVSDHGAEAAEVDEASV